MQAWLKELVRRKKALSAWARRGDRLTEDPLDLSELFNPAVFLNAFRQQTARRIGVSMDGLQLASSWQRDDLKRRVKQRAQVVEISGLLIQGASFDGKALAEADEVTRPGL